jgi:hypothetical protein
MIVFLGWTEQDVPSEPRGVNCSQETEMQTTAIFASIFVAIFAAIFLPLIMSGERSRAAEDRARARRMAEARMNARLLRLDI